MSRYFCHEHPDVLVLATRVIDARPGAVVLKQSPFHPGGGGQLADRGRLRWSGGEARVTGIEADGDRHWHLLAEPIEMQGTVEAVVDPAFRALMAELHTDTHVLNALEPEINDVIRQDLPVRYAYVTAAEALAERGLVRNRSVAPPPAADGTIRVVEIVGLDRQACGGTHLTSTGRSRPLRILKIDNKGRHNRRIRIGLAGASPH